MEVPAPDIISASRGTDIPAFYADWFFHRIETGYSVWNNPFNGKKNYILKSATTRLYDTEAKIICIVSKKGAQCIECHHKDI